MKCTFKAFLFVTFFVAFVSCGKNQTSSHEDTLDRIRRTGQIEACTIIQPPLVIKDSKTGELSGVYVELLNIIAKKMNAKINWHETTFGNATGDLAAQRCDVMAAPLFALIPRAAAVSFIAPPIHYQGLSAVIGKNSRFITAKNISVFNKPGIAVALATGSAGDAFATEHLKNANLRRIDVQPSDPARNLTEVSANRADIAIFDTATCNLYAKQHPEVTVLFRNPPINLFPVSWAVRQDDIKWLHFLETALQFLETQGITAQLEKKYNAYLFHLVKRYKLQ